jgi:hypothetical protein
MHNYHFYSFIYTFNVTLWYNHDVNVGETVLANRSLIYVIEEDKEIQCVIVVQKGRDTKLQRHFSWHVVRHRSNFTQNIQLKESCPELLTTLVQMTCFE